MRGILLIGVCLVSTGLIIKGAGEVRFRPVIPIHYTLREVASVKELLKSKLDCMAVEPVVYERLPDLRDLHPALRKKVFIRVLLPSVLIAQKKIELQRAILLRLNRKRASGIPLSEEEKNYIVRMMKKYKAKKISELLARFHTHPVSLILAQAAVESGWGTSRFALEANNLFGLWQFRGRGGLKARDSGARLRVCRTVLQCIEEYIYNLNAGWAYSDYRRVRLYTDNPLVLVEHLSNYSILRDEYTRRLKDVINHNRLYEYDRCRLKD